MTRFFSRMALTITFGEMDPAEQKNARSAIVLMRFSKLARGMLETEMKRISTGSPFEAKPWATAAPL